MKVRTCKKCQKWRLAKISHFCTSGPVKNVKNGSWLKIHIFAVPDLWKMSKMKIGQNFTFLQVRTCQKFQKWKLAKISHFCWSGPVKNVKNEIWLKFHIFAGPDLSKCQKWKLAKNSHFAGPDLSIMSKMEVG